MPAHRATFRVYYEDTDAGGVMYHARYLAFAERARTEALRAMNLFPAALAAAHGIHFAVTRAAIDFRRPFRLDDAVEVATVPLERRAVSLVLRQQLHGPLGLHAEATITLAAIRMPEGRPARLPPDWTRILDRWSASEPIGEHGKVSLP